MPRSARALIAISLFNAVSAIGGGIALVTGVLPVPTFLLRHTPFDTYLVPGLFLAVVIGGSSLAGAIALIGHAKRARFISAAAGLTMVGWIIGETVIVRGFSWLQGIYLVTGLLVAGLSERGTGGRNVGTRKVTTSGPHRPLTTSDGSSVVVEQDPVCRPPR